MYIYLGSCHVSRSIRLVCTHFSMFLLSLHIVLTPHTYSISVLYRIVPSLFHLYRVEAIRIEPHHSSYHLNWPNNLITPNSSVYWKKLAEPLSWKSFVTKPWVGGERGPFDRNISKSQEEIENAICMDRYRFEDIIPCSEEDMKIQLGLGGTKYESIHDGSGRRYPSIIDLRRDKILNHLSVADFLGTRAFLPLRFEDLNTNGTSMLLKSVEKATGLKAKCNATMGKAHRHLLSNKAITRHKPLSDDYIEWMTKYVDWEVENRIGYFKRALKESTLG